MSDAAARIGSCANGIGLAAPGSIVSAEDFAAISAARTQLKSAHAFCATSMQDGYEQARQQGYQDAMRHALSDLADVQRSLRLLEEGETSPLERLVLAAVRKILGEQEPATLVASIVQQTLVACCLQLETVTVIVHPDVAASVRHRLANLSPAGLRIKVTTADDIDETGCEIHTPFGIIDAGLETQLLALEQSLGQQAMESTRA